ncbi:MAG: TRAP transporter substrate-binding protein [Desulfomonile tiedjei]|uniref:TRAP transporter substrate-binding protein n=1 Tax=Desulfomonile tiedjei TaxID=2358 RepID=A0A9D6V2D5_9BACT|nr:TRAP transporter substrate-binding protein [Desulfomonile tiedjei]
MRRLGYACFGWFVVAFCLLFLAGPVRSDEKVVKLRYATFSPPMSGLAALSDQWCKEVEKRSNGKVKISFHPGGSLAPANQSYEAAVRGITDISLSATQWTAGRFPMSELIHLPLGVKSAFQGTNLINAWFKEFKPKEFDDTKVLYLFASGPSHFMTLKQLSSINDLKGLKIRAAGDTSKIVAAMGAVPVSVPIGDAYEAFQRGICEGVLLSAETLKSFRWGDLLRGLQINDGIGAVNALMVVMNKKKWDSLPPDIQKIIEEVSQEWIERTGKGWDEIDKEATEYGESKGLKVVRISKEEESVTAQKVKPLLDAYVGNMKNLGLPGEETLKFAIDYIKAHP